MNDKYRLSGFARFHLPKKGVGISKENTIVTGRKLWVKPTPGDNAAGNHTTAMICESAYIFWPGNEG
jgi:hypothetical protein